MRSTGVVPELPQGAQAVGYFRVQRDGELRLSREDLALAEKAFSKPHEVVLLIESGDAGPANASFFFWDGDRMHGDFPFLEFPFDPSLLAAREMMRQNRTESPRETAAPARAAAELDPYAVSRPEIRAMPKRVSNPPQEPVRNTRVPRIAWAMLALICVVAVVGTIAALKFAERSRTPAPPAARPAAPALVSLGLQVERYRRGDLRLSWNHDAPVIANATSGTLMVQDGVTPRIIPLDASLVRGGSLLYSPVSDQVQMRLTVESPGQTATEMVLVVIPSGGNPTVDPLSVRNAAPTLTQGLEPQASGEAPARPRPVKPFVPPDSPARAAQPEVALPPPSAPAVQMRALVPTVDLGGSPVPPAPSARSETPAGRGQTSTTAAVTPPNQPSPPRLTPAEAISRTTPSVPEMFRGPNYKPEVVEVTLSLDATGKIVNARSTSTSRLPWLNMAAEAAARSWKFKPARLGDRPVPSEVVLSFKFEPRR